MYNELKQNTITFYGLKEYPYYDVNKNGTVDYFDEKGDYNYYNDVKTTAKNLGREESLRELIISPLKETDTQGTYEVSCKEMRQDNNCELSFNHNEPPSHERFEQFCCDITKYRIHRETTNLNEIEMSFNLNFAYTKEDIKKDPTLARPESIHSCNAKYDSRKSPYIEATKITNDKQIIHERYLPEQSPYHDQYYQYAKDICKGNKDKVPDWVKNELYNRTHNNPSHQNQPEWKTGTTLVSGTVFKAINSYIRNNPPQQVDDIKIDRSAFAYFVTYDPDLYNACGKEVRKDPEIALAAVKGAMEYYDKINIPLELLESKDFLGKSELADPENKEYLQKLKNQALEHEKTDRFTLFNPVLTKQQAQEFTLSNLDDEIAVTLKEQTFDTNTIEHSKDTQSRADEGIH